MHAFYLFIYMPFGINLLIKGGFLITLDKQDNKIVLKGS